jgi:hypothetical protein
MLLVLGWLLVPAALVLLPAAAGRLAFILAALLVQLLGLGLLTSAYRPALKPRAQNPWRGAA